MQNSAAPAAEEGGAVAVFAHAHEPLPTLIATLRRMVRKAKTPVIILEVGAEHNFERTEEFGASDG